MVKHRPEQTPAPAPSSEATPTAQPLSTVQPVQPAPREGLTPQQRGSLVGMGLWLLIFALCGVLLLVVILRFARRQWIDRPRRPAPVPPIVADPWQEAGRRMSLEKVGDPKLREPKTPPPEGGNPPWNR